MIRDVEAMPDRAPTKLRCPCPGCGNGEEFSSQRAYFARTALTGDGDVFDEEIYGYSDASFSIVCGRCGAVVEPGDTASRAVEERARREASGLVRSELTDVLGEAIYGAAAGFIARLLKGARS